MTGWISFGFLLALALTDTAAGAMWRASLLVLPYWAGLIDMSQATAIIDWSLL